ncbi:LOW QUALITY PROTEIN: hypothetical protein TMLG_03778, partial [Mycobacterium tuberculosis SUMu012]
AGRRHRGRCQDNDV